MKEYIIYCEGAETLEKKTPRKAEDTPSLETLNIRLDQALRT